jgi:DNA-directed RNA polymerase specialized sigma24 family protein
MARTTPTPPPLLQRAARGSETALHALPGRHKERAYHVAASLRTGALEPAALEPPQQALTPAALLERWELVFALHRVVSMLPEAHRQVLVLVDLEGLEQEQVAWLLDLDPGVVQARLSQARRLVRQELMEEAAVDLI